MNIRILILSALCIATISFSQKAEARPFTRNCPSHADTNFQEIVDYMESNMAAVRAIYEADNSYHPRRGANRRVERRLDRGRKLDRLWFDCDADDTPLCKNADARHAMGAASRKIRICYNKVRERTLAPDGRGFCSLMSLVAHEFGHAVGMKKDRAGNHSRNQNDRVYRWGWAWRDFCIDNGHDRELD